MCSMHKSYRSVNSQWNQNQFKLLFCDFIRCLFSFFDTKFEYSTANKTVVVSLISDVSTHLTILLINKTIINWANRMRVCARVARVRERERGCSGMQCECSAWRVNKKSHHMTVCMQFEASVVTSSFSLRILCQYKTVEIGPCGGKT